jgi:hypothetical protein
LWRRKDVIPEERGIAKEMLEELVARYEQTMRRAGVVRLVYM